MEYQKIKNLLDNTPNQPSKFRTKNWVEINDDALGPYNKDNQIKFETSMLQSSLCVCSDPYILVSGPITVVGAVAHDATKAADINNKQTVFKNCTLFTDYITEINNTEVNNAKDLDVVMLMYDLIK